MLSKAGSNVIETKPNVNRYVEQETSTYSSFNPRSVAGLQRFVRALRGKLSRTASRVPLNDSCTHSHCWDTSYDFHQEPLFLSSFFPYLRVLSSLLQDV